MGVWDPGLPRWMDPMDIFGYSQKTMDDMGAGIVKRVPTASGKKSGKSQWRQTDLFSYKWASRNRIPYDAVGFGRMSSLSAAQKEAQSFTESTRKRKTPEPDMPKYAPGTLGRKYTPKYKQVPVVRGTSRRRYVHHHPVTGNHCLYTAFSDVGPYEQSLRTLAEAMLLHYCARVGDNRYDLLGAPVSVGNPEQGVGAFTTWSKLVINFRLRIRSTSGANEQTANAVIINYVKAANTTPVFNTFDNLVDQLYTALIGYLPNGYEISSVNLFRADEDSVTVTSGDSVVSDCILHDPDAGNHNFKFSAVAKYKIQNTTEADASTDVHNKDNIHANPLDGLVYGFKNQVPKWKPGFLANLGSDANALNDLESLQDRPIQGVTVPNLTNVAGTTFHMPPALPYTLWTNSMGRSKILIKPGEHRVLKLTESFDGSINEWARRYLPTYSGTYGTDIPPGGNAMLIALKPTFRTGTNEDLKVETETERTYHGLIRRKKLTATPMVNVLT